MYLLDTNIISDLGKVPRVRKKDREKFSNLLEWNESVNPEQCFISAITVLEMQHGIEKQRKEHKDINALTKYFDIVINSFQDRIIPLCHNCAEPFSKIFPGKGQGKEFDHSIASIALIKNYTIVTRNVKDFNEITDLNIINPWDPTTWESK